VPGHIHLRYAMYPVGFIFSSDPWNDKWEFELCSISRIGALAELMLF